MRSGEVTLPAPGQRRVPVEVEPPAYGLGRKAWAKAVVAVDRGQRSGWALAGRWLRFGPQLLPEGTYLVAYSEDFSGVTVRVGVVGETRLLTVAVVTAGRGCWAPPVVEALLNDARLARA